MIYQICGNYAHFLIFVIILKGLQSPLEHGVSAEGTSFQKNKKHFSTNSEDGCNPPKQRKTQTNSQKMFEKRMQTANIASSIMKIRKHTIVSKSKRTYKVASSTNGTKNYDVAICNIPSCTCADFKKNGKVVFCKHIVFLHMCYLEVNLWKHLAIAI